MSQIKNALAGAYNAPIDLDPVSVLRYLVLLSCIVPLPSTSLSRADTHTTLAIFLSDAHPLSLSLFLIHVHECMCILQTPNYEAHHPSDTDASAVASEDYSSAAHTHPEEGGEKVEGKPVVGGGWGWGGWVGGRLGGWQ